MDISIASHIDVEQPVKRLFIWGMMGVGKSTYAKSIAKSLGWKLVDLDKMIEKSTAMTIKQIFNEYGESWFRDKESHALKDVMTEDEVVVAVGGGTPHFNSNASNMKAAGLCVWLDAPIGMLAERLSKATEARPLIDGLDETELRDKLEFLYSERHASFAQAHFIISVNNISQKEGVALIKQIIQGKS